MLADVVPYLRCPVCAAGSAIPAALSDAGGALRCQRGHAFDIARGGYATLTRGRAPHTGDSAVMVAAREAFLGAGHFAFISDALAAVAPDRGLIVDIGAGTGHHLARVLDAHRGTVGLALDSAKPALRRAARAHVRAGAVLADAWQALPIADGVAAAVLNVFAPRNGAEFARILSASGELLVVTPTDDHLHELVEELHLLRVDQTKPERTRASLQPWLRPAAPPVEYQRRLTLTRPEVVSVVAMGPSAAHLDPAGLAERVSAMSEPVSVTASIRLTRYRRP